LCFHDLRHHAIAELAESGASDQTIMSIAGHVSRKMLERYSHIRMDAKRKALEALSKMPGGYGTIHGTMGQSAPTFTDYRFNGCDRWWAKKIGGRYRARVATSPQVQNRMVEILRMCSFTLSNPDTASGHSWQIQL
jgi:hypothetical protein